MHLLWKKTVSKNPNPKTFSCIYPKPHYALKVNQISHLQLFKRFHSNILIHSIDSQIALISTNSFIKPKSEEGTIIDPSNFDPGAELDKFWDHLRSKKVPKTNQESLNTLKSIKRGPTETVRNSGWPKITQNEDNPNSNSRQRSRNCEGLACTA